MELGYCARALSSATSVQHSHAETHRHLADIVNHDPKTRVGIFASVSTWMLGYPDPALRLSDEEQAHARRRGHPFDFRWALSMGALEPNLVNSRNYSNVLKNVND
jgi:hypothetical protein